MAHKRRKPKRKPSAPAYATQQAFARYIAAQYTPAALVAAREAQPPHPDLIDVLLRIELRLGGILHELRVAAKRDRRRDAAA